VLVPALLPPFTGLLEAPAPRAFGLRGLVNDRFLAALAALSVLAATPMVCAAVMATLTRSCAASRRIVDAPGGTCVSACRFARDFAVWLSGLLRVCPPATQIV
jgi:hypothetical protein